MKTKTLVVIISILGAVLFLETGYLIGLNSHQERRIYKNRSLYRSLPEHNSFDQDYYRGINQARANINSLIREQDRMQAGSLTRIKSRETESGRLVTLNLHGMKKDDINIEAKDGYLTIEAQKTDENSSSSMLQIINLPAGADLSAITAVYDKDLLTINMPKSKVNKKQGGASVKVPVK